MARTVAKSKGEAKPGGLPARAIKPADVAKAPADPVARANALKSIGLCVLAGVLWFVGCPGINLWFLAWAAMVPVLFAVERAPSNRRAFLYAWIAGVIGNGGGFYWLTGLLTRFAHMPWIAAIGVMALFAAYQGLIFGFFGLLARVIRKHEPRLPMALVAPVVLVAIELAMPVIFPFYVAITQSWQLHVIQIADLTGPLGVSALLLMVNGAIYDLWIDRKKRAVSAGVTAGVLALALIYGHVRIGQVERARASAPSLNVGLVQPNVSFDLKGEITRGQWAAGQLRDLQTQSQRLQDEGVDLIVWPETAYPYRISRATLNDFPAERPFRIRRGFNVPLVVGAVTRPLQNSGVRFPYNSALMLDRDDHFTGRYDKTFLMLFGEYTPGRDSIDWISRALPDTAGQYSRGDRPGTLPFRTLDGREYKLGMMICYEDILPGFGRELAKLHPHLLVNVTNDAWFGDTAEPWEHLGLSVFRAVEARTDLVRAVNTGVSAFVDATGRVYAKTYAVDPSVDERGADAIRARVSLMEGGHTVYSRVGDLFGYLCAGATVFLWLAWPRIKRRRSNAPLADGPAS